MVRERSFFPVNEASLSSSDHTSHFLHHILVEITLLSGIPNKDVTYSLVSMTTPSWNWNALTIRSDDCYYNVLLQ